ncbi:MAG: secretin and TonB N-terminal domain-containing protein, partial [Desulfobacteraceae bacterium]|nr:secretin and TonB N-terminal domain-containing protein [Desulfobacteraceae bacterium]
MGKNMRQLPRNQFRKVYWIIVGFIILGIFFFPSCATKKDQSINNADIKPLQEEKVDSEATNEPINKSKIVTAIEVTHKSDAVEIFIKGNKELKYTSIKQSFPFGIAIYLPDTILDENITSIVPETGDISNIISSYADKNKTTAKIEILLNKDLPYNIEKKAETLQVIIATDNKIETPDNKQADALKQDTKTLQIPKGIATLSEIEFNVEDEGYTELTLTTSHPIKYSFSKGNKGILYLNLSKTDIPRRHKRPFETKYFKSAVSRILPIQKSKNSKIEISMREKVPYQVVQDNNIITVRFEPSSIEPPKFTKAEKIAAQKAAEGNNSKVASRELTPPKTFDNPKQAKPETAENYKKDEGSKPTSAVKNSPKVTQVTTPATTKLTPQEIAYKAMVGETEYTGEKIKLDFYETDIKNVFRILSGISSKNFAIDKNVTGNVTLTLDKPIPWDQVLDLVLSMNQLGKTETGDVIRIATQATLSNEAKQKHAKFETMQKAKQAQEALQPMITEYIPINYANAATDIMPHVKKILTPKRGSVSVDTRTNMIIITDTKEVVDKTKHLIYTLDNVTPQIMISAKI